MNRLALVATGLLLSTTASMAQVAPFDMSPMPEPVAGGSPAAEPALPPAGPPAAPPAEPEVSAPADPPAQPWEQAAPAAEPATQASAPAAPPRLRYLIPYPKLTLSGETDTQSWSVFLTREQAASAAKLNIGYQNAIVAAPELSTLKVMINDVAVVDEPIQSSDAVRDLTVNVPPGLLKAGSNSVTMSAIMRHRTDCTIQSTYELWTEVASAGTYLSFADPAASGFRHVGDIAAVGVDAQGATEYRIVAPATEAAGAVAPVVRLAEALAISANMPNQSVFISQQATGPGGPGKLTAVVGLPSEIAGVLDRVPEGATVSPVMGFVDDAKTGPSTLVISGPTWPSIASAIESLVIPVDREAQSRRATLSTRTWRLPDAPMLRGQSNLTFAQLGAATEEFDGRRFRTDFAFGIPADFYAGAYGEATLLLDAAYSAEVLPGSHIDVYVNGNMAATVPITQGGGAILRQLPVSVTMRHFRPGANTLALEAVLMTRADQVCAPGATGLTTPRFALFDTSQFVMPDYARIARRPDLAGIAGTGFPYNRAEKPVALIVQHAEPAALSAAATLMAQMSVAAGRAIPVDGTLTAASVSGRDAIFVGEIDTMAPSVLAQVGVSETTRTAWSPMAFDATETSSTSITDAAFDRWRNELSGSGWHGSVSSLEDWLYRNFGLTLGSLKLAPSDSAAYTPPGNVGMIMAQQESPDESGTWTVVSAPTTSALEAGMKTLGAQANWNRIGGRISTVDSDLHEVGTVDVGRFHFFETQPASLSNYRLIVANWLSANALSFGAALVVMCSLLGLSTKLLLSMLGRRA